MRTSVAVFLSAIFVSSAYVYAEENITSTNHVDQELCSEYMNSRMLVKVDPDNYGYLGLNDDGLATLKKIRDAYREREALFESRYRNMSTIFHGLELNRLIEGNMLLWGPPGGAKSGVVDFVLDSEIMPSFAIQMNQMMTEQAFVGGQIFDEAIKGKYAIEIEGSLASFHTGGVDEIDKGNAAVSASLLRLLNERQILAGGRKIDAKLESVYATSNATLPEFLQTFQEAGMVTVGPALLNRFQIKALSYNWLPADDLSDLLFAREQRRQMNSLRERMPELNNHVFFRKPPPINWRDARHLAHMIFKPSEYLTSAYQEVMTSLRDESHRAIKISEEAHRQSPHLEPFIYFPSADITTRKVLEDPDIILMSAFLDFLDSPMSDDANLEQMTAQSIELDVSSIWRASMMATTLAPGRAHLNIDRNNPALAHIDYGVRIDSSKARDERETKMLQNMESEQEAFNRLISSKMAEIQKHLQIRAQFRLKSAGMRKDLEESSFEMLFEGLK